MTTPDTALSELRDGFAAPPDDARPMMRWWWFGPRVDRTDLIADLDAMRAAGIGGVELSVVYPLSEDSDRYLSETFLADARFAAEAAAERGMRFDLTLGSGWSFGGPHITDETAARKLSWDRRDISVAAADIPVANSWPGDRFIAAYVGDGSIQEPPEEYDVVAVEDGVLHIPAGNGPRLLLLCTARLTGQQVKRAAVGAEGPVLDHFSRAATEAHIAAVCDPLLDAVPAELLGSVFCDSLEAYAADWSLGVFEAFRAKHGYDPVPVLHRLHTGSAAGRDLRADYYGTLTALYEQNFVVPLRAWAAGRGVPLRIQGYGEPPAGISSYRFADAFEGEGWGWRELTQTRWATSAAHLYDRDVVSSETWTWIHSPSFRATPMDLRGEAHEHLLAGINQFIGHGWPHSPSSVPGKGWMLYAAGAFDTRNPWSPAMPGLISYLHRLSWLMRQGRHIADVGVYTSPRAVGAILRSGEPSELNLWRSTNDFVGDALTGAIREGGFDYDAWDDDAVFPAIERYGALVLPRGSVVPADVAQRLSAHILDGGVVLALGEAPTGVEGATVVAGESALPERLAALLGGPDALTDSADVGVAHRSIGDLEVYFVANTGAEEVRTRLHPRTPFGTVQEWDAATGTARVRAGVAAGIPLHLEPYAATVIVTTPVAAEGVDATTPASADGVRIALPTWSVRFPDDEAAVPVTTPHIWERDGRPDYSGTAEYTTQFVLDEEPFADLVLDFGRCAPHPAGDHEEIGIRGRSFRVAVAPPVGEIAEVIVNGRHAGVVWGTPYRLAVGGLLHAGENTVVLKVSNTGGNAVAADPRVVADAEATTAKYGRRFRMQDFDLAADRVRSGLACVPVLRVGTQA
ncbi:glycosyl hydrolase [Microbacterium sp. M28]|uniref:glycosyl hydrolase n=1 Tax=Microbacterium sp. M28 TaxID=2962064 RepID=UPI0021F4EC77|nr:glycosyl hydrolase [Microbacterium sp. M28]UYO97112.1 glycosyl hydrolase [Microbacterium sp. M28]